MKIKKLIAPIIVTVISLAYLIFYGLLLTVYIPDMPVWGRIIGGVIALGLSFVSIWMFIERYNEIRSGEEDDLSKY